MRILSALLIGLVFGCGIVLSGMGNPAKVLNFFDLAGGWDPSLILVMGGALAVTYLGYRAVLRRPAPLLDRAFHLPKSRVIDARLLGGSAVFGIGWGITGFCPGGALPMLGTGNTGVLIFLAAMTAGILGARSAIRWLDRHGAKPAPFRH
ncbi:YeeE/YedE family protein [Rhodobacter sp. Har01]|uniref:YeeE/YedE family protein n=1 Tax=Rhodobacter sp. Har01 TaxID=2883999 RepID=UPI001D076CD0|nr:YeeE/YedE family protein [Rhodobacter sp. Har01]MCB6179387.1 YeeE/YedE family protein [Rhodobacter sp. Har01]